MPPQKKNKEVLAQRISRDKKKFIKNLETYLDNKGDDDIWSFLMNSKKQKIVSDVFLHLPKEQQINIFMSFLTSNPKNIKSLVDDMKVKELQEIIAQSSVSMSMSSKNIKKKQNKKNDARNDARNDAHHVKKKRKVEIEPTLTGAKTLGNLDGMQSFFFNNDMNAEKTQNSFMGEFIRVHQNEKDGIKPSSHRQQSSKSIIRMKKMSVPGISLSIISPSISIAKKGLLYQYMISSVSDANTWKSIVGHVVDKELVNKIDTLVSEGNFPSEQSYNSRLLELSKTAFVTPPPIDSKDVSEKCSVLENEMKIAQKDMKSSREFCLTVYVLYKLMNLNPPRVKIL